MFYSARFMEYLNVIEEYVPIEISRDSILAIAITQICYILVLFYILSMELFSGGLITFTTKDKYGVLASININI